MDYANLPVFSMMTQKMRYLSARQSVLAQNIANADTPGYAPRDVRAPDFKRMLSQTGQSVPLARTNPAHMTGKGGANGNNYKVNTLKDSYETNPDGNKVALDEEVQKMSFNQADYQQMTTLYRKTLDLYKTAIGRTGG